MIRDVRHPESVKLTKGSDLGKRRAEGAIQSQQGGPRRRERRKPSQLWYRLAQMLEGKGQEVDKLSRNNVLW